MNSTIRTTTTTTTATSTAPLESVNISCINTYSVEVLAMSATSCSLSLIGGVVILITFVTLPEIRNFTRKLVLCLTFADFITAFAYLMSVIRYTNISRGHVVTSEENILCKVQSFFTTYSSLVSFFFTSIIAIYIFDTVVNKSDRLGTTKWFVVFNVVSWIVPGSIVVSALAMDVLGMDDTKTGGTGPWCWIATSAENQLMWMLVTGKGWEISCYLITMSLYALLKIHMRLYHRRTRFHQIHTSLRDEDRNFLYVWFLLYVLRVWGTLRFFLYVTIRPPCGELYMKVLLCLQALGDPGQAFCNFFLFCLLDETVFTKLKQIVCCKGEKDSERTNLLIPDPINRDANEEDNHLDDTERDNNSSRYSSIRSTTRSEELHRDSSTTRDRRFAVSF